MYHTETQFSLACYHGNHELIKHLLNKVDPSFNNNESLINASSRNQIKIVKLLLADSRVDPSSLSNMSLRLASVHGHYDVCKILLSDERVNPEVFDANNVTNWHIFSHPRITSAIRKRIFIDLLNTPDCAIEMIQNTIVTENLAELLPEIIYANQPRVLKHLCKILSPADITDDLLWSTCIHGYVEQFKILHEIYHWTSYIQQEQYFRLAVYHRKLDIVKYLLSINVFPRFCFSERDVQLMQQQCIDFQNFRQLAVNHSAFVELFSYSDIAQLLIKYYQPTPLYIVAVHAVSTGNIGVVKVINDSVGFMSYPPLMFAALYYRQKAIKNMLLEHPRTVYSLFPYYGYLLELSEEDIVT